MDTQPAALPLRADPATEGMLGSLQRTEDVCFSPSGQRLAIAGFSSHRVLVAAVAVGPDGTLELSCAMAWC